MAVKWLKPKVRLKFNIYYFMKAFLRSTRIAPKKASLIAKLVRGMPVNEAISALERTPKKGAKIIKELLKSAAQNAEHNDQQLKESLIIKSLIINKAQAYNRGIPMARGRMRRIRKFMSHIEVELGVKEAEEAKIKKDKQKTESGKRTITVTEEQAAFKPERETGLADSKKAAKSSSQMPQKKVKSSGSVAVKNKKESAAKGAAVKSNKKSSSTSA